MATAAILTPQFHELIRFIDSVITAVDSGTVPELENLDEKVDKLCRQVENADAQTALDMKPLVGEMIGRLDVLAESLTAFQDRLEKGKSS